MASKQSSGLRTPTDAPPELDAYETTVYYIRAYEKDADRTRTTFKHRARNAMLVVSVLGAATAVIGAVTAALALPVLGVATAITSGAATVVTTWDGFFRHRELWLQRSRVAARLHELQRTLDVQRRLASTPTEVVELASQGMQQLNEILRDDQSSWSALHAKNHQLSTRDQT